MAPKMALSQTLKLRNIDKIGIYKKWWLEATCRSVLKHLYIVI